MPPPSSRMTKNRAQPERYRPGKAEIDDPESEEDSSEEEEEADDLKHAVTKAPPPKASSFPSKATLAIDISKVGKQIAVPNKPPDDELEGFVTASESSAEDGSDEDDSEDEADSSEEESSSDEASKPRMLAPKFISKSKRAQSSASIQGATEKDKAAEADRLRKEKADAMLQVQLERDAAARAAGKKNWDDEDIAPEDQVDDTDGLDGEAEQAAWKLRELKRVRRDRLAIEEKEKEREEIERRRNMTAEEREAEDKLYLEAQKEEREGKGKMAYMQKYFHKGAFFGGAGEQDEEVRNALNRDFAGARFEDETGDKGVLPEYMRIRDMTRLGRKGRTKYRDLQNEDTGRWGQDVGKKKTDYSGLDERFQPDDPRPGHERTGANSAPVGERRRREDDDNRDREDKRPRRD